MSRIIFGSTAIKHWFPDFREPKDLDVIDTELDYLKYPKGSNEVFNSPTLSTLAPQEYLGKDLLLTIKIAHLSWDIKWDKHMADVQFLLSKDCKLDRVFYHFIFNDFQNVHGKKQVHMDVPETDFFTQSITRSIPHDELHELVKLSSEPMHKLIREDLSKPYCSESLFNQLSEDERLMCAVEEVFVIALERYSDYPIKISRYKALKQLITSMTTGWFNIYLIVNFKKIMEFPLDKLKEIRND